MARIPPLRVVCVYAHACKRERGHGCEHDSRNEANPKFAMQYACMYIYIYIYRLHNVCHILHATHHTCTYCSQCHTYCGRIRLRPTPNLPTNIVDFKGFDSITILI